ncbi:MAG TPA: hypothetical protein VGH59_10240 [Casimicrobiaceae bacterium]|jgi:hypothetical protein
MTFHVPAEIERFRVRTGRLWSDPSDGCNGAFEIPHPMAASSLRFVVIISDEGGREGGWEHVSVSTRTRTPTWNEMAYLKQLFWDAEDCVVQFHPPASDYVNNHQHCLHLWRLRGVAFPMPPTIFVGIKEMGVLR